jgi:hypothetical protein
MPYVLNLLPSQPKQDTRPVPVELRSFGCVPGAHGTQIIWLASGIFPGSMHVVQGVLPMLTRSSSHLSQSLSRVQSDTPGQV